MPAKYIQLATQLRGEIASLRFNGQNRLPTEAEIGKRYQVSRQTVRNALRLLQEDGLINKRQGSGSYISERKQASDAKQIAVVTTYINDYIFPGILHEIQAELGRNGYSTLIYATENKVEKEREILSDVLSKDVSAIIIEGSKTALPTPNQDLFQQLGQNGIPVLFLHGTYPNLPDFPSVMDDNFSGGYMLASYLMGKGHESIAALFKSDDMQGPLRYFGAASAFVESRKRIRDEYICWYDTEDRNEVMSQKGNSRIEAFLDRVQDNASAIICYNDEIAYNLVKRLLDMGKKIPEDVAVVSFDNSFYSHIGPVPITSIGHRMKAGKAAADMLLSVLRGEEPDSVRMPWELHQRASS